MKQYIPNKVTMCCNTRSWQIIQGKETYKNISGYFKRQVIKKHPICTNKRCKNYLRSTVLGKSNFLELSKENAHTQTHTNTHSRTLPHTPARTPTVERDREKEIERVRENDSKRQREQEIEI